MSKISRRTILAGSAAMLAASGAQRAQAANDVKPKVTVITQWSAGSDGAAITALGKAVQVFLGRFFYWWDTDKLSGRG